MMLLLCLLIAVIIVLSSIYVMAISNAFVPPIALAVVCFVYALYVGADYGRIFNVSALLVIASVVVSSFASCNVAFNNWTRRNRIAIVAVLFGIVFGFVFGFIAGDLSKAMFVKVGMLRADEDAWFIPAVALFCAIDGAVAVLFAQHHVRTRHEKSIRGGI